MSILNFVLNLSDLNIHATIEKNTLKNILESIPHQKFCFYHLPTRGWAGIKLRDVWYVSNVSIIFDCSMLLYYLFYMFMGFTKHFYIIFGTNLLTRGPTQIVVFLPISVFWRKGISNGVETEWNLRESYFWNGSNPGAWSTCKGSNEEATRQGGAPYPPGRAPTLVGPLWPPWPTSFAYISPYTLKTSRSTIVMVGARQMPWDG